MLKKSNHSPEDKNGHGVLCFLDVETTGLSVTQNDRICEIAILKVFPNGETSPWQSLVNPCRQISKGAAMVNNITPEMLIDAPLFKHIAPKVLELIEGTTIVCHNAGFDIAFVKTELNNCGFSLPDIPVIDTLKIAREHFNFPSNNLGKIASFLALPTTQSHRALADVTTTYMIFKYFITELEKKSIELSQLTKSCHVY